MMATAQNDDYLARLERIRSKDGQSILMVGMDLQLVVPRKTSTKTSRKREVTGNTLYPVSLFGAFTLGFIAAAGGHYARFRLISGEDLPDAGMEMLLTGAIGLVVGFALTRLFRLTSKAHVGLQSIGVFVMVCSFHNLPHWLPGPMAAAFSPQWVAQTVMTTPPNSVRFGENFLPLFDPISDCGPPPVMPDLAQTPELAQMVSETGLAGVGGLEPTTLGFGDRCSTN